jgi:hypothetical protein
MAILDVWLTEDGDLLDIITIHSATQGYRRRDVHRVPNLGRVEGIGDRLLVRSSCHDNKYDNFHWSLGLGTPYRGTRHCATKRCCFVDFGSFKTSLRQE